MSTWRELTDRREPHGDDKVRLWYDLGGGRLRSCVVKRWQQDAGTIERIGNTLAAEDRAPLPPVYGDGVSRADRG